MIHWERCQTCQKFLETEQEQESGVCEYCVIKPTIYFETLDNLPLSGEISQYFNNIKTTPFTYKIIKYDDN